MLLHFIEKNILCYRLQFQYEEITNKIKSRGQTELLKLSILKMQSRNTPTNG